MIGARRGTVNVHMMVLHHQHHDKGGAHRVDDCFKREHRKPGGVVIGRQHGVHGQRHKEDPRVQAWHHNGCSTRVSRPASFAPELEGDEERVDRDDQRADDLSISVFQHAGNLPDAQPQCRAVNVAAGRMRRP